MLTREEPEDDDRESVQDCRAASDVDHDDEEWVDETNVTQTQKESKRSASAAASRSRTTSRSSKLKAEKAKETRNARKAKKEHQKKLRQAYQVERYLEDAGALRPTDVLLGRGPTLCRHRTLVCASRWCERPLASLSLFPLSRATCPSLSLSLFRFLPPLILALLSFSWQPATPPSGSCAT
jgi:hypothetical protein